MHVYHETKLDYQKREYIDIDMNWYNWYET